MITHAAAGEANEGLRVRGEMYALSAEPTPTHRPSTRLAAFMLASAVYPTDIERDRHYAIWTAHTKQGVHMKVNHSCKIGELQAHRTDRRRLPGRISIGNRMFLFRAARALASPASQWVQRRWHLPQPAKNSPRAMADTIIKMQFPMLAAIKPSFRAAVSERYPVERSARIFIPIHAQTHIEFRPRPIVGNGNDYTLSATGLITETVGSFPSVSGVTVESSVGVPSFGGGGILGRNEYTLQVNTNDNAKTSACSGGAPSVRCGSNSFTRPTIKPKVQRPCSSNIGS